MVFTHANYLESGSQASVIALIDPSKEVLEKLWIKAVALKDTAYPFITTTLRSPNFAHTYTQTL